ncbi:MAG: hypothetical protein PVJ39_17475 [Gammaproteobacteria bacterium]|jgi:hypothetical protein
MEAYAITSYLTYQQQPLIKDQGDGRASAMIQRCKGELDDLTSVAEAARADIAKGNIAEIHAESGPEHEKALPVPYCFDILDALSVHSAVDSAITKLGRSYQQ